MEVARIALTDQGRARHGSLAHVHTCLCSVRLEELGDHGTRHHSILSRALITAVWSVSDNEPSGKMRS